MSKELLTDQAACAAYGACRGVAMGRGELNISDWDELPDEVRNGYRRAVSNVFEGVTDPIKLHELHVKSRTENGWTHGLAYDRARKQSPLLGPWQTLSDATRFSWQLLAEIAIAFGGKSEVVK